MLGTAGHAPGREEIDQHDLAGDGRARHLGAAVERGQIERRHRLADHRRGQLLGIAPGPQGQGEIDREHDEQHRPAPGRRGGASSLSGRRHRAHARAARRRPRRPASGGRERLTTPPNAMITAPIQIHGTSGLQIGAHGPAALARRDRRARRRGRRRKLVRIAVSLVVCCCSGKKRRSGCISPTTWPPRLTMMRRVVGGEIGAWTLRDAVEMQHIAGDGEIVAGRDDFDVLGLEGRGGDAGDRDGEPDMGDGHAIGGARQMQRAARGCSPSGRGTAGCARPIRPARADEHPGGEPEAERGQDELPSVDDQAGDQRHDAPPPGPPTGAAARRPDRRASRRAAGRRPRRSAAAPSAARRCG